MLDINSNSKAQLFLAGLDTAKGVLIALVEEANSMKVWTIEL